MSPCRTYVREIVGARVFNLGVNTSVAVFDVIDEVIAPLSAEVPERPSVMEFYDPEFEIPPVLADTEPLPGRRSSPARSDGPAAVRCPPAPAGSRTRGRRTPSPRAAPAPRPTAGR